MTPFCDVDNPTICLSAGLLGGSLGRRECGDGVGGPSEKGAEQPHAASRRCHRGGAGGGPETLQKCIFPRHHTSESGWVWYHLGPAKPWAMCQEG